MSTSVRLHSLDAFRGATVAGMILVNNPGSWDAIYPQLEHAAWNGWTFTDWIFPFFLFIVGVSLVFSTAKRKESGIESGALHRQVFRRSLILFALGLFLNGFPFGLLGHPFDFSTIRIPGVLQRIAVCYLVVAVLYLHTTWRTQLGLAVGLLAVYWILLILVPVPGYGAGVLLPTGSLPWFIDSHLLAGHTWSGAPAPGFDPEGVLSTLGAIATTLSGVLAGQWLRSASSSEARTAGMFVVGNLLLLLGVILNVWLPINKNLWTSSYVVFMAGWALICLATFYWLIDVKGYSRWVRPFIVYGRNAIAVFVLSGIIARVLGLIRVDRPDGSTVPLKRYLFDTVFLPLASPVNASLFFAIAFLLVMYAIVWALWKKGWFINV